MEQPEIENWQCREPSAGVGKNQIRIKSHELVIAFCCLYTVSTRILNADFSGLKRVHSPIKDQREAIMRNLCC